jgi:hypothetical protein
MNIRQVLSVPIDESRFVTRFVSVDERGVPFESERVAATYGFVKTGSTVRFWTRNDFTRILDNEVSRFHILRGEQSETGTSHFADPDNNSLAPFSQITARRCETINDQVGAG